MKYFLIFAKTIKENISQKMKQKTLLNWLIIYQLLIKLMKSKLQKNNKETKVFEQINDLVYYDMI